MIARIKRAALLGFVLCSVLAVVKSGAGDVLAQDQTRDSQAAQLGLKADPRVNPMYIPPPAEMLAPGATPRRADALQFTMNQNPSRSCPAEFPGFPEGKLVSWDVYPKAAQAATYAMQIWSTVLNGTRPVIVDACLYSKLPDGKLGKASPSSWHTIITAPDESTAYPVALANQLLDQDLNTSDVPEIGASFSMDYSWYFGTDGKVPPAQRDFVTVVLHEIGHGLGFLGSADFDDGLGAKECNGTGGTGCIDTPPAAFDRLVEAGNKSVVDGFVSPSVALGDALTGGNLFINGAAANAANGNSRAQLYAPRPWEPGSSYGHLDDAVFDPTANALMTHALKLQEAIHHPGAVTLGILSDQGWSVNNRSSVYVDWSHVGYEDGSVSNPFGTVYRGAQAVLDGGTVWITQGNYQDRIVISRPMWLKTTGGTVTIGK